MFYYIDGKVALLEQALCVVDVGGVGYEIHTSQNTIARLKIGERARIYTYLYLREEICDLYGFADLEEKNCFLQLISVSGVGPKAALAILSVAPPSRLALAIITGDEKMLTQAPGIGKKIAQRIVLELRDKMSKSQLEVASPSAAAVLETPGKGGAVNHTQEAIAALMVLGYSQAEALQAIEGLDGLENATTEEIIRACLKRLALR